MASPYWYAQGEWAGGGLGTFASHDFLLGAKYGAQAVGIGAVAGSQATSLSSGS